MQPSMSESEWGHAPRHRSADTKSVVSLAEFNAALDARDMILRRMLLLPGRRGTPVMLCQNGASGPYSLATCSQDSVFLQTLSGEDLYAVYPRARGRQAESEDAVRAAAAKEAVRAAAAQDLFA